MQRLGFFGGCFNPPTIAHFELALKALDEAKLDKVYFVPMGDYYKKDGLISAETRLEMLEKMVKDEPRLEVSRIQMDQKKNLQAIDTFRLINKEFESSQNFFIMGSDNYKQIGNWKDAEELLASYDYIILSRENFEKDNLIIVNTNEYLQSISSSLIRERIRKGESIENLVTKNVEKYILEKGLYK